MFSALLVITAACLYAMTSPKKFEVAELKKEVEKRAVSVILLVTCAEMLPDPPKVWRQDNNERESMRARVVDQSFVAACVYGFVSTLFPTP